MLYVPFTKVDLPYGEFGNMSPHPIVYQGKTWKTSEALFQSMRFDDEKIKDAIRAEKSPMGAKMKAKKLRDNMAIEPMSEEDVNNMRLCVRLKLDQHEAVKNLLLSTGNAQIFENVASRKNRESSKFWGAYWSDSDDGPELIGKNVLGKILMDYRWMFTQFMAARGDDVSDDSIDPTILARQIFKQHIPDATEYLVLAFYNGDKLCITFANKNESSREFDLIMSDPESISKLIDFVQLSNTD